MSYWDVVLFILYFLSIAFIYATWNLYFLQRRGVRTLPVYPLIGNMGCRMINNEHLLDILDRAYHTFTNEKYFGFYEFQTPLLVLKDVEVIKQILIKDFHHFQDHSLFVSEDPLFGKNLFSLGGRKWRDMRATLSPAFTSSKMKNMFGFVAECGDIMAKYYSNKIQIKNNEILEIEMKDAFTRYTNDVIATSAFGVKVDSFNEPKNEFFSMGSFKSKSFERLIKIYGFMVMPQIMRFFKIGLFNEKVVNFFRDLVKDQMKTREENNIIRPDMIHLLMEARKGSLRHDKNIEIPDTGFATVQESEIGKRMIKYELSDDDILAQVMLFFFAGFDTSSGLLSFMSVELAINPEAQKKLQNEIDELSKKCNGKPSYGDIQNMKYMDMVVSETLRKWPSGPILNRICNKTYKFPSNTNEKTYQVNVREKIWIPIYSIHRDPKYYNNPEEFIPERFSEENKSSIKPFTYFPFGMGPRNCIGSRFALMEIKSVMFYMLEKFDFVQISKTTYPPKLDSSSQSVRSKGGFWIGLKSRH